MVYFVMQIKRVVKIFPIILITALLLCGCMGALAYAALEAHDSEEDNAKVQIGLVGDLDTYMGVDIRAMIRLLSGRFGMEFMDLSEQEARRLLRAGRLSTYVLVPDGFVDAFSSGDTDVTITYVTADGSKGLGSMIMDEAAGAISGLITTSESAIYGMQLFLMEQGRTAELYDATEAMNIVCIRMLANIYSICDVEIMRERGQVSTAGYYMCSVLLVFMMLGGINCSHLFTRTNMELPKLLAARGQSAASQVLGEYLAYLLLMMMCLCVVFVVMGAAIWQGIFDVSEWGDFPVGELVCFYAQLFPVAAMVCAMQFLIYEMVSGIVSSILLQFLGTIALGYLSGCFYPLSFFPEGLQRLGVRLPTGAALRYSCGCLSGDGRVVDVLLLAAYLALFLVLAVMARRRRIA